MKCDPIVYKLMGGIELQVVIITGGYCSHLDTQTKG